jgi:hypothetical protein
MATEELEITKLIFARLKAEQCLDEMDRETVAYRIAEIMVAAKQMFTKTLSRLTNVNGESTGSMEEDLTGLQNTFVYMCDLMYDFDSAYMKALKLPPVAKEKVAGLDGEEDD